MLGNERILGNSIYNRTISTAHMSRKKSSIIYHTSLQIFQLTDFSTVKPFWGTFWKLLQSRLHYSSAYDPQMDGQTEVVNRPFGNLLWSLVRGHPKRWEFAIPQAEQQHL